MASRSDGNVWIYHERQEALLCGQHALNNLVQAAVFTAHGLAEIAQQLDQMELNYMAQNDSGGVRSKDYVKRMAEGSGNVDASGNFSIEVLRSALMNQYSLSLPNIRQEGTREIEVTEIEGFICHRESHWFAIRKINGRYWNLNSMNERPLSISHFRLAAEIEALQNEGYSVFCVVDPGLPPPCTSASDRDRGLPQYWWMEDDLVKGKTNATTGATDPWRNVGTGMRLDGRSTTTMDTSSSGREGDGVAEDVSFQQAILASARDAASSGMMMGGNDIDNLSEEEMIRMAVAASLQEEEPDRAVRPEIELKPEPSATEPGVVRIQFRLPDGKRVIRRFFGSDLVAMLYAYVEDYCSSGGRRLELRAGFPPKDISVHMDKTIEEAKLNGETVQGRFI